MGAGKSTVGPILAEIMDYEFVDSDLLIEQEAGMSITHIFEKLGQETFRKLETTMIGKISQKEGLVVALGGGAPLREENRELIKNGISVYLQVDPKTVLTRTKGDKRPLLAGLNDQHRLAKIRKLLNNRKKYYLKADLIVESSKRSPELIAGKIKQKVKKYAHHTS